MEWNYHESFLFRWLFPRVRCQKSASHITAGPPMRQHHPTFQRNARVRWNGRSTARIIASLPARPTEVDVRVAFSPPRERNWTPLLHARPIPARHGWRSGPQAPGWCILHGPVGRFRREGARATRNPMWLLREAFGQLFRLSGLLLLLAGGKEKVGKIRDRRPQSTDTFHTPSLPITRLFIVDHGF